MRLRPQLLIPKSFQECFTYEQQIQWLKNKIDNIDTTGGGDYDALRAQIEEIQSEINTLNDEVRGNIAQISALQANVSANTQRIVDTEHDVDLLELNKQDSLTFDTEPKRGSTNPVTSDGVAKSTFVMFKSDNKSVIDLTGTGSYAVTEDGTQIEVDEISRINFKFQTLSTINFSSQDNILATCALRLKYSDGTQKRIIVSMNITGSFNCSEDAEGNITNARIQFLRQIVRPNAMLYINGESFKEIVLYLNSSRVSLIRVYGTERHTVEELQSVVAYNEIADRVPNLNVLNSSETQNYKTKIATLLSNAIKDGLGSLKDSITQKGV